MNVDEKSLAAEMFKKMNLPVPEVPLPAAAEQPKPGKSQKLQESDSESNESESSSSEEEEEKKSKFQVVQRYKNSQPLTLRPDQIHRIREPEAFEKKVIVKTKK